MKSLLLSFVRTINCKNTLEDIHIAIQRRQYNIFAQVKKVLNKTRSHLLSQSQEYEFSSFGRSQGKPNNEATILTPQPEKKKLRPYTFICDPLFLRPDPTCSISCCVLSCFLFGNCLVLQFQDTLHFTSALIVSFN